MSNHRLMVIFMFVVVFSLLTTSLSYNPPNAFAADPYADIVISAGEYGNPVALTSGIPVPAVLGAPNGSFIQLALNNEIVVKFDDNVAFQSCDDSPDLRIHTWDTIFPANADVSVSDDGITWHFVGNIPDTNAILYADIDLDATAGVPQSITHVKLLTTFEDPQYPKLGFDLNAVEALFTEDQLCPIPPQECVEKVIDFESVGNVDCSQIVSAPISIGGNLVTLKVGTPEYITIQGGHPISLPPFLVAAVPPTDGQTVTVGNPAESFRSNGIGDQPANNPAGNVCFFSDTTTFDGTQDPNRGGSSTFYFLTFDDPITSLSLDLYDYADDTVYGGAFFNACNGGTDACNIGAVATLTAFANDDFTNPVGTATYTVDASYEDGQIANLSIPSAQGVTFLSASLTLSAPDIGTGIDNIAFCEDTAPPAEELEIEKFYTHTNNNWDLVCTEFVDIIIEDIVVGQECVTYREANINTEDVFALPLPDTDGTYELLGDEKRKKTVVNPGQYIQATTITVPTEQTVWFEEDVSICSDIGTINPNKVPGGVQVVRIDTDGNVFDIDDDLVLGIGGSLSLDGTIVSVHVDDVPAGDTIRVMVKFQPSDALGIIGNECTLTANLLDVDDEIIDSVSADLIIVQK